MTPILVPLLLGAAFAQPAQGPARGASESMITLDQAAMVRIEAQGATGLFCELIDHVRGPFASDGDSDGRSCRFELLLDAGSYKLRLRGPAKADGLANISVTPFPESVATPVRLEDGQSFDGALRAGTQASVWLRVEDKRAQNLRVLGRTAGQVALWRDGRWLESIAFSDEGGVLGPAQPVHDWRLSRVLEPGDYKLVAYGTAPHGWPDGGESDALLISSGFTSAPESRAAQVQLPWSGSVAFLLPRGRTFATAALAEAPMQPFSLGLQPIADDGTLGGSAHGCTIAARTLDPRCLTREGGSGRAVLWLRGAPGARVDLTWGPLVDGEAHDGESGLGSATTLTVPEEGDHLIGLSEAPVDPDSAPLGCALYEEESGALAASDLVLVDEKHPLSRSWNSRGRDALWFHLGSSSTVEIATDPARHARCELYRMSAQGHDERVSDSPTDPACQLKLHLSAGDYQLALQEGNVGIQSVRISASSWFGLLGKKSDATAGKSGCLMRAKLTPGLRYALVTNRDVAPTTARGLILRPMPDALAQALTATLDAGRELKLELARVGRLEVRSVAGAPFRCRLQSGAQVQSSGGSCTIELATAHEVLLLENTGAEALTLTVAPAWSPPPRPAPSAFTPRALQLPTLRPGAPLFFDFGREESHSMLFEVAEAGLYHLTTEGLLASDCTLRTPVVLEVAHDEGSGRGRNCLVAQYLRPGSYRLTVTTRGESRGRLGVRLSRFAARPGPSLPGEGEAFFRAGEGELLQQRISIPKAGTYALATNARSVPLVCRLDDAEGWPLVALPAPCALTIALPAGELLWTQLPPTVESMRHTTLTKVRRPVLWTGRKIHPLTLHTWHEAQLNRSGKDRWSLTLEADLDVDFLLTNRMQGRLYRVDPRDKSLKAIELIPPAGSDAASDGEVDEAAPEPEASSSDGDSADAPTPEPAPDGDDSAPAEPIERPQRQPRRASAGSSQAATQLHLAAGRYQLVTEHSQGDVAIRYRLYVGSEVLTPGTSREAPVPSVVTVRMPRAGTLRVHTSGEADVRCRLSDAGGKLIAEVLDNGEDWNCAFAEPLAAGDYTLAIASETQGGGTTRVWVELPPSEAAGPLADGQLLQLGRGVLEADVPAAPGAEVEEVSFSAPTPFSCALSEDGALLAHAQETTACHFLIRPRGALHVRLWTLDKPAQVRVALEQKGIEPLRGGKLAAGRAALVAVPRAGRWATGEHIDCIAGSERGLLRDCSGEPSLEGVPTIFARARDDGAGPLQLEEQRFDDAQPQRERALARPLPFLQTSASGGRALHLLAATSSAGEAASLLCGFAGGARVLTTSGCFAASAVGGEATARLSSAAAPVEVELLRLSAKVPDESAQLQPGRQHLSWRGDTGMFSVPGGGVRLELLLPPAAWAVLVDARQAPLDLCPPESALARCQLFAAGDGARLLVWSPADPQVELTALAAASEATPLALGPGGLYEALPPAGPLVFRVDAAAGARALEITGASGCALTLPGGLRILGCRALVPASAPGVSEPATLRLESRGQALRIALGESNGQPLGFGPLPKPSGTPLLAARAEAIGDAPAERSFNVESDALVHLRADRGVLALAQGEALLEVSGAGGPAAIDRLLSKGSYRLLARPFGQERAPATVSWTQEPLLALEEGVGSERWIAPGETRLFRFALASPGAIGLGLRASAETLDCAVLDAGQRTLGTGCQQYLPLESGAYLLSVRAPAGSPPMRFVPVLFGLQGSRRGVPPEFLHDFFQRIGVQP